MKKTTYKLVASGLLIALSIVLTRIFGINLPLPGFAGVTGFRISIGQVPIIIASLALGPLWGMAVGIVSDITGFFLYYSGLPNPLITLVSALVGLLPYLLVKMTGKLRYSWRLFISISVTQVLCSMFLQTVALALMYAVTMNVPAIQAFGVLLAYRVLFILATIPVYYVITYYAMMGLSRAKLVPLTPVGH